MVSTKSIVFVVLMIVQINYVPTWAISKNCANCDIRDSVPSKFRINKLSNQLEHLSSNNRDPRQRAIRAFTEDSTFASVTGIDWTIDNNNLISFSITSAFSSEDQSNIASLGISIQSPMGTFAEMASSTTRDHNSFMEISGIDNTATILTTTPANPTITSDDRSTTTTSPPESERNLALILGLTLGLGIPILLAIVGGLIYYFKIYRPRHSRIVMISS